jgi:predicted nucleic acid-binding protein
MIYFVEQIEPYRTAVAPLWHAVHVNQMQVITSELTLLEVLVKPIRDGNTTLATFYRDLVLGTPSLRPVSITGQLLMAAAHLRAAFNLKTPDAIHAATALDAKCTLFVTNDAGFRRVPNLNVILLSDLLIP